MKTLWRNLSLCKFRIICFGLLIHVIILSQSQAQDLTRPYNDLSHESRAFGHQKPYRLYLPEGYRESDKRYPVIYFFHGWGGRHFKDDNALLEYTMIKDIVDKYQVILVMWDGNIEEKEPRPYNIGNHKDIKFPVQMKDYFPELIAHVDSAYRTLTDRNHRGIIGFSMGGIMSFFLAGKYPDKVCAAVNLAGTPEFFIGYPENHTLYPVRYTFRNLMEVNTRQQGGDSDILVYLNEEVRKGAEWEGNPYEFWGFHGGHMVDKPGETVAFEMAVKFITETFKNVMPLPDKWSHYDLYDKFAVWGYQVESNKAVPGFLYLKNVDKKGFGFYTNRWLPDGPGISDVQASITTAPRYIPEMTYDIVDYSVITGSYQISKIKSSSNGCITINLNGTGNETGIYSAGDGPDYIALDYNLGNRKRYLMIDEHNELTLRLFNRGGEGSMPQKITITVQPVDSAIHLTASRITLDVAAGERIVTLPSLEVACHKLPPPHGEPSQVRFKIIIQTASDVFKDEIIVPVLFDVPDFTNLKTDDGLLIRDKAYGKGNGNGLADAGERILIYEGDHRLRLYTDDPWVIYQEEALVDEQIPAIWEDGFTLSSIIAISKDCPDGHIIEFTGNYETNTYNPIERNLHWGKVRIAVNNPK
jgi:enterochelin esterase-like enzyme